MSASGGFVLWAPPGAEGPWTPTFSLLDFRPFPFLTLVSDTNGSARGRRSFYPDLFNIILFFCIVRRHGNVTVFICYFAISAISLFPVRFSLCCTYQILPYHRQLFNVILYSYLTKYYPNLITYFIVTYLTLPLNLIFLLLLDLSYFNPQFIKKEGWFKPLTTSSSAALYWQDGTRNWTCLQSNCRHQAVDIRVSSNSLL